MKIVNSRKLRLLVVTQKPGISVYLRGKDQTASESLIYKIVLKIIKAGRKAYAVILDQSFKPRRIAAVEYIRLLCGAGH